jgi:uncharacterized protein YigE (DUF2233 family)
MRGRVVQSLMSAIATLFAIFDLRQYTPELFWKQPNGEPYGSLENIPRRNGSVGGQLVFATNGGMYQADRSPLGLYVENGRELRRANTAVGPGNFYIKPNGIFYISGDGASILETRHFLQQRPHSDIATQSGPMLVIDGAINPNFLRNPNSRKIRNGVGVQDIHRVVFVISNDPVTFGKFAQFFRNELHCSNALYLHRPPQPESATPRQRLRIRKTLVFRSGRGRG